MGLTQRLGSIASLFLVAVAFVALAASLPRGSQAESPASPPRGIAGDGWADVILGQPNFSETAPYATLPNKLWLPHGVIVDTRDPLNQVFYVYDGGNSRVLGFDLEDCYADVALEEACTANLVLGQPDFTSATCNGDSAFQGYPKRAPASAATLCGSQEDQISLTEGASGSSMAIDDDGNLYVTDFWNHRVLKYNDPYAPGEDVEADDVWGQDDFTGNECNEGRGLGEPDDDSICFYWGNRLDRVNNWTAGVDVDQDGNLWVTDSGNKRALRFPAGQATGAKQADLVLGQPSLTSTPSASKLCYLTEDLVPHHLTAPSAIRVTDSGRVYVNDSQCNQVIYFDPPFATDQSNSVLGKSFGGLLRIDNGQGIDFDPTRPGTLWIADLTDSTLGLYDETTEMLIHQVGIPGNGNFFGDASGSVGIDADGNLLLAIGVGSFDNDVLLLVKDESSGSPVYEQTPPVRLFRMQEKPRTDRDFPDQLTGVAASSDQLIVSDRNLGGPVTGGRILFWNRDSGKTLFESLTTYKPADGYLSGDGPQGQPSGFDEGLNCCNAIKVDNATPTRHLWALAGSEVWVYDLPLTTGQLPSKIITFPIPLLGDPSTLVTTSGVMWGLLPSADGSFLWISQRDWSRVIRVRNPLSSSPEVDVILGQGILTSTSCGRALSKLCQPGALSYDNYGNLFVSDHALEFNGNKRLLVFDPLPDDNTSPIFRPSASKEFPNVATWEPAFDSLNQLVIGFNPYFQGGIGSIRFPGVYLDPLDPTPGDPDYFLNDYFSMPIAATFDDDDNLYIAAHNRSRILVYEHPLPSAPQVPTMTPTLTPTPTPTPTVTPSPMNTLTPTITPTKQPEPGDSDDDGCSDQRENGPDEKLGGLRDYKNPYDFYDVSGDQIIDLSNDVLGVILHYAPTGTEAAYDVNFDRGPSTGPNPWNMTAPDGVIDLSIDILGVIQQYDHDCR